MSSSSKKIDAFKIPLKKIVKATNNFENLIGEGGFGKVYKGNLYWFGKRTDIAARRLYSDYGQGDLEFWNEISMLGLSNLKHDNLVSFVGFCDEEDQKIIITEYEAKQSLDVHLKDLNLTWTQRLRICVGIARALSYIHFDEGHDLSVIHRNIKSSKVLLDDNWKPKLSGFGVSLKNSKARRNRYLLADEVIGTIGYVDPTYEKTGFVTHKSDVYSLGVLLFEVLCGRKAFRPDEQEQQSPQLFKYDYKEGKVEDDAVKLDSISDPHLYPNKKPRTWAPSFNATVRLDASDTSSSGNETSNNKQMSFQYTLSDGYGYKKSASFVGRKPSSFGRGYSQSASFGYDMGPGDNIDPPNKYGVDSPFTVTARSPEKVSNPSPVNLQKASPANEPTAAYVASPAMVTTTSPVNIPTTIGPLDKPGSSSIGIEGAKRAKPSSIESVSIDIINKSIPNGNISITRELTDSPAKEPTPAYVTPLPAIIKTPSLLNLSIPSPANEITPGYIVAIPSPADDQLPIYHDFKLHPLYTMKKLEQYIHSANEELLAQSVKYQYDDLENYLDLDDMIDQALKEQMDQDPQLIGSQTETQKHSNWNTQCFLE